MSAYRRLEMLLSSILPDGKADLVVAAIEALIDERADERIDAALGRGNYREE